MHQLPPIGVPADMALQDLAATGIRDIRTISILDIRGEITDHGEPRIFQAHGRVILRPFFADNGILKPCFFKSRLPVIDSSDQVGSPFFWSGRLVIVEDWFFGLAKFSAL